MRSSVDLPHPLGPITETKSPCVTERLTPLRAGTPITSFFTGLKNVLWMFSTDSLDAVIASLSVMAGLVPAIHDLVAFLGKKDVDATRTRACPSSALLNGDSRVNPTVADKRDMRGHDGGYHHRLRRSRK